MLRYVLLCAAGVFVSGSPCGDNDKATETIQAAMPCRLNLPPTQATNSAALITWGKDGVLVDTRSERRMTIRKEEGGGWHQDLIIQPVKKDDAGFYVCLLSANNDYNVIGTTSLLATTNDTFVWLLMTGPVTVLSEVKDSKIKDSEVKNSEVKRSLTYTWHCQAAGVDDVDWIFPPTLALRHHSTSKTNGTHGGISTSLTLRQQEDRTPMEFCLQCVGLCSNAPRLTSPCLTAVLLSPASPKIVSGSATTFIEDLGSNVTLPCLVISTPPLQTLQWLRNNALLPLSPDRVKGGTVYRPALTIGRVTQADGGSYVCRATNAMGTTDGAPRHLGLIAMTITQSIGSRLELPCSVTSSSSAITQVTWYKDGAALNTSSDVRLSGGVPDDPSLTIYPLGQADEAKYMCLVTRQQGNTTTSQAVRLRLLIQRRVAIIANPLTIRVVIACGMVLTVVIFIVLLCCMARKELLPKWLHCGEMMVDVQCVVQRCGNFPSNTSLADPCQMKREGQTSILVTDRLRACCPGKPTKTSSADPCLKKRESQMCMLVTDRLREPAVDAALKAYSEAVLANQQLARDKCQELIPLMDAASVKTVLRSFAHNLPLHLLPSLGLTSPVNTLRLTPHPAPDWCACGYCIPTTTTATTVDQQHGHAKDRQCCRQEECVTRSAMFVDLCMKPHVLEVVGILDHGDRLGNEEEPRFNRQALRSQAKKLFLLWQSVGNGVAEGGRGMDYVPCCVEARIRWAFPDDKSLEQFLNQT